MHTPTEYAVFFTGPDNGPAFRRVGSLEEAVQVVEHLRNELGVLDANVHSLSPVPLSFRTYYRVEVPGHGDVPAAEANADAVPSYQPSYEPSYEPADAFAQTVQVSFGSDLDTPAVADSELGYAVAEALADGAVGAEVPVPSEGDEVVEVPATPLGRGRYDGEERSGRMGFFAR
jgi:hypothetical protein